ncbi:MAG: PLP-dependent transferase [Anaerolineae bacterium]|nr:PLP-dependent transferase [Anaerolineae bacterium]
MATQRRLSIFTRSVHGGHAPRDPHAVVPAAPPIVPTVGYVHPSMESSDHALGSPGGDSAHPLDFVYARGGAQTQVLLEDAIAHLEESEGALSFASGMAAIHAAILACVPAGGVIVAAEQLYGVTRSLLDWLVGAMGMQVHYVDVFNLDQVQEAVTRLAPAAVMCEVLTNPLARVVRVDRVAEIAREAGAHLIVDNTFATPFLIHPLSCGASLVVHSATKFLNGHGDVLGGVVAGPANLLQVVRGHRKLLGSNLGPFEAWLALRGMRTFAVRMRQACLNARQVAAWLDDNERVETLFYPGLSSDPHHEDARDLFRRNNFGAMLAFRLRDAGRAEVFSFIERLQLILPVTSLGDVTTLISHPATASHRGLTPEARDALGVTENTVRMSIGIEDANDLIADLEQALKL